MQRRSAIKNIALSIGATFSVPAWANAWNSTQFDTPSHFISSTQEQTLLSLLETIIPKTDTPGAVDLGVQSFVLTMIKDCYDTKAQETFKNGLVKIDNAAKKINNLSVSQLSDAQKLSIATAFVDSNVAEEKDFLRLVKNLTIQGYLSSEYVLLNHRKFEFAPGHYYGCVPVNK